MVLKAKCISRPNLVPDVPSTTSMIGSDNFFYHSLPTSFDRRSTVRNQMILFFAIVNDYECENDAIN